MPRRPAFLLALPLSPSLSACPPPHTSTPIRRRPPTPRRRPATAAVQPPLSPYPLYAVLAVCAAAGQAAGTHTRAGRALSAPVAAMLAAAALANLGLLPAAPPGALGAAQAAAARVATPLLLLGADLRMIFRDTRRLAGAFGVAVAGSAVGALVAWCVVRRMPGLPGGAWQLAAAVAGKNIGGGINFWGILDTYGADATTRFAAVGLCADNLVGLLYFPLNSYLCDRLVGDAGRRKGRAVAEEAATKPKNDAAAPPTVSAMTRAIAVSLGIIAVVHRVAPSAPLPAAAALTVALSTAAPAALAPLAGAGDALGSLALFALFAAAGVSGGSLSVLFGGDARASSLVFVVFCAVLYGVHFFVVLLAVRAPWRRWRWVRRGGSGAGEGESNAERAKLLLLASNAAIGGPATAAALAKAKGFDDAVVPATVVGTFGNCVGSFAGLLVGKAIELFLL